MEISSRSQDEVSQRLRRSPGGRGLDRQAGTSSIRPRVAASVNGGFVAAWANNQDAWFQRFDFLGKPAGRQGPGQLRHPRSARLLDVAMASDGSFVVVFNQVFLGGDTILAQRYSASGVPLGAVTGLDFGTPRVFRSKARVTAGRDGSLLAVWQEVDGFYVMANRFRRGARLLVRRLPGWRRARSMSSRYPSLSSTPTAPGWWCGTPWPGSWRNGWTPPGI